ncbi:MAG TPA: glycosyltransferase, partial [Gemmatimonadales bacterium]|nr:glycosyltransferase [Gemmatimonadales bacterium]
MRLAVFTNMYPARVTTFFERDLRALISSGVEVDVFAIHPLDPSQWQYTLRLLGPEVLPRERVHHLSQAAAWASARPWPPARARRFVGDAVQILAAAARFGPVPLAKTAYVLPQAWAWAEAFQDRFDHVLAYWGNYAGTCAYLFHRLATPGIPFSIWLHAGADLYFRPVFLARKVAYADRIITCCAFNRGYLARAFPTMADSLTRKVHVCYHGLDLNTLRFNPDHRLPNRLVAVGRLAQDKGFDNLLRAMRALADRGTVTQLDLVGAGPEERPLGALARRLDLAAHVRFRGWLPFAEVQTAMQNATVLVHP